jgi:threonine aldolase
VSVDQEKVQMVTHLDVNREEIEKASAKIGELVNELLSRRASEPERRA